MKKDKLNMRDMFFISLVVDKSKNLLPPLEFSWISAVSHTLILFTNMSKIFGL